MDVWMDGWMDGWMVSERSAISVGPDSSLIY